MYTAVLSGMLPPHVPAELCRGCQYMLLLQTIDVSNNNMSGQPMSVLANVGLLERINLQNNRVGPASRCVPSGRHPSAMKIRLCVQFTGTIPAGMSSEHLEVGLCPLLLFLLQP